MDTEHDCDLTLDQWAALKALRTPGAIPGKAARHQLPRLIELELVVMADDFPLLTTRGRKALIRGSLRLLDVAA